VRARWLTKPDRFHPEVMARDLEHARRRHACPANGKDGDAADCTCEPPAELVDQEWQGAARMAFARKAAGGLLSAIDLQALDRYPDPTMTGATDG
jgi:hypothetical protein